MRLAVARRCLSPPLLLLVIGLLALGSAAPLRAATLPEAMIAIVDYQRVLRESKAGKGIHAQIAAYRTRYQTAIKAEELKLRGIEDDLKRQRGVLALKVFQERRRQFEARVIKLQRQVQERTRRLDRAFEYRTCILSGAKVLVF